MRRLRTLLLPVNSSNADTPAGACRSTSWSSQRPRPRPAKSGATIRRPICQRSPTWCARTAPTSLPSSRTVHTCHEAIHCETSSRFSCSAGMLSVSLAFASSTQQQSWSTRISAASLASAVMRTAPGRGGSNVSVTSTTVACAQHPVVDRDGATVGSVAGRARASAPVNSAPVSVERCARFFGDEVGIDCRAHGQACGGRADDLRL